VTESLNIAMISYYLPSGSKIGVGYQVHALANALVARGHKIAVFSGCQPSDGALYRTETITLSGANRTFKFALALRRLDWTQFDVLHAHGDDYWLGHRLAPNHLRTLHGSCFDEALHVHGARERLRMFLLGISEVIASLLADETVAVSRRTQRWLPWVATTIPNGVDVQRFTPVERSSRPSLLFVGTYLQRKRGKFLADIFETQVLKAIPDAELWMVCEDAPPRPGIKVFGRVSDAELAELYGRAWVFCLPSTYEGFGIPYVEAMAAGCPIVASRNGGAIEVLDGGRLGLLAPDDELGRALINVLTSPDLRERMSTRGVAAASRYHMSDVASRYETAYFQLTRRKASGGE
jgi:glycosyltransferase involved in cell wall biosynthesis